MCTDASERICFLAWVAHPEHLISAEFQNIILVIYKSFEVRQEETKGQREQSIIGGEESTDKEKAVAKLCDLKKFQAAVLDQKQQFLKWK